MARRAEERAQAPRPAPRYRDVAAELREEFDLRGELGRGASAIVYLARERRLDRDVAIKVVRGSVLDDDDARERLEREARTVARLDHPNIVTLYGVRSLSGDRLALVMRYVPGSTLRALLDQRGSLEPDEVERIIRDIAAALGHAHRNGVVHRDVKPENIFLEAASGRALLSDFGVARTGEAGPATISGVAVGTPTYMSPEQIDGPEIDGRSDLYSLGLVAWEMLAGRRPWAGEGLYSIIYKQKSEALPPLDEIRTDVPEHLVYVVEGMLMKHPEERFASTDVLLEQLDRAIPPIGWRRWHAERRRRFAADQRSTERAETYAEARRRGASRMSAALETIRFDRRRAARAPSEGEPASADAPAPTPLAERRAPERTPFAHADDFAKDPRGRRVRLAAIGVAAIALAGAAVVTLQHRPAAAVAARPAAAPIGDRRAIELPIARDTSPMPDSARVAPAADSSLLQAAVAPEPGSLAPTESAGEPVIAPAPLAVPPKGASADRPATRRAPVPLPPPPARLDRIEPAPSDGPARSADRDPPSPTVAFAADRGTLAAGGRHSCAILSGGSARCWGADDRGQLGGSSRAGGVVGSLAFTQIAAGAAHSCAVSRAGDAFCWGENDRGQLGDGTTIPRDAPVRVAGSATFRFVRAGAAHTCGLSREGQVFCWGSNANGQLGAAVGASQPTPVAVSGGIEFGALATGWQHTCAIAVDGTLYCWGLNSSGQLGDGTRTDRRAPTRVSSPDRFIAVAAGGAHTCAITVSHEVLCWGRNSSGQLGIGAPGDRATPTRVPGALGALGITAGGVHTCARTASAQVLCWGQNTYGQLGDGTNTERTTPVSVLGGLAVSTVQASGSHTCALSTSGETWCWGYNVDGQLGDGTRTHQPRPVRVDAFP